MVVYAATQNLYHHMAVAAKSLLINTPRIDRVIFLTETDDFPEDLPPIVERINVGAQKWFPEDGPNYRSEWTYMTLIRLVLPELLPDEERCLWLDVDTICNRDIGPLLDMDLAGNLVAMTEEPQRSRVPFAYHNSGVLLMDLKALRKTGVWKDWVRIVNTRPLSAPDQDAINLRCQCQILQIPAVWNAAICTAQPAAARIIHFAGTREWGNKPLWREYEQMTWEG